MISIICCYNDLKILKNMLLKSLENQNCDYELVLLDNTLNKYKSAAEALNEGAMKAKGKYLIFIHQDVEFNDELLLERVVDYINRFEDRVIVGVAGANDYTGTYSNIKHGEAKKNAGSYRLTKEVKVQTLDEVLFATSRKTFLELIFDETTCNNWHLYSVDLCLSGEIKGIPSYVIPIDLYHKSGGEISIYYYESLQKVAKKYKKQFNKIYTTCSVIDTSYFAMLKYISTKKLKIFIKNNFPNMKIPRILKNNNI